MQLLAHGLQQCPARQLRRGERGIAYLPGREEASRPGFASAREYARVLDCLRIHVLAGLVPPDADLAELEAVYAVNLAEAAALGKHMLMAAY